MKASPLAWWRTAVCLLGAAGGVLLVRALDEGLSGAHRPLDAGHAAAGLVLAAAAMPGPLLGFFVAPGSSEKSRGLAVGGSVVTALAAALGGALLYRHLDRPTATVLLSFAWCVLALPLAAVDFLRLRGGSASRE